MSADVVVIGAGPHGLAILAALAARPEPWPAHVVVVDPQKGWATAWDDKLARLALDRLRSPQVHHPGPRPMALRDLVEGLPEADQGSLRSTEDERAPTPAGMRALVDHLAAGLGPVDWRRARATGVAVSPGSDPRQLALEGGQATPGAGGLHDGPGALTVELDDGTALSARSVVLAHNPSSPRLPDWAPPLVASGVARHASLVDLRTESLDGRHVAIVGGGLTAGSLASAALELGARVTLLTRRPLRAQPYDVDASWLGPRRLADYRAASLPERRSLIDIARDGGTMPARVLERLWEHERTAGSGLVIREAVEVGLEIFELLAERELESGGGEVAAAVDQVWLATGVENDAEADPLAGPLIAALGVPVLAGLPEVTSDLRLPGSRVFVAGPYAALEVGPAARNLAGARPAAARIAAALAADSGA